MARGRSSHHGAGGGALLACNRAIERQDEYKTSVKKVQARAKMMAESLCSGGDLEDVLLKSDGADDWLLQSRNRLKALAEGNAKRMNDVEDFVDAVREVRAEVQRRQGAQGEGGGGDAGDDDDAPDYERSIQEAVERVRQRREGDPSRADLEDHEMSIEVRQALGEKIQKKRPRASRGGDEDEDDLEIVQDRLGVDDVHALKCPITGMLFENPVKNKVCGHTYDRAGLDQMLGTNKHTCPIAGCANKSVSASQVEEDEEMKLKVKRHKNREEAERRKRDLEEEDEDGEGGYTMVE
ncbi:hypothetical protein ACHAWF_013557 [Thalassiosira exigua]